MYDNQKSFDENYPRLSAGIAIAGILLLVALVVGAVVI
jgi:hypothetical protein